MPRADVPALLGALVLIASTAAAHEAGTTRAVMSIDHDGSYAVAVSTDAATLVGRLEVARRQPRTTPETREQLQTAFDSLCDEIPHHLGVEFDGRPEMLRAECRIEPDAATGQDVLNVIGVTVRLVGLAPLSATSVRWRYDLTSTSYSFVMSAPAGQTARELWLDGGQQSPSLPVIRPPAPPTRLRAAWLEASAGQRTVVPHGLGQILFLAGVAWLSSRLGIVLKMASAFGAGQAVTALMCAAATLAIPFGLVACIAVSLLGIAAVAFASRSAVPWRHPIAFGLGLPHGLWLGSQLQARGVPIPHGGVDAAVFTAGAVAAQVGLAAFLWFVAGGGAAGRTTSPVGSARRSRR